MGIGIEEAGRGRRFERLLVVSTAVVLSLAIVLGGVGIGAGGRTRASE